MPSTRAETPRAWNFSSRTRRSSSRTPFMPMRPLMRARPMKRSGYARMSPDSSSLVTPKGTERTMPARASGRCGRSWPCRSRWDAPRRPERPCSGWERCPRSWEYCTPCRSLASGSPPRGDARRGRSDRLPEPGRRHLAIGLLDQRRHELPIGAPVDAHAHPAAPADVGRAEEALGVEEDERFLLAQRRGQPHREVIGAVVMVVELREELALHAPGRLAPRDLLRGLGESETDAPQPFDGRAHGALRRGSPRGHDL